MSDFKFFTQNAPKMNTKRLDSLHKLVFRDEGAATCAVLMNRLTTINSCVYCFIKDEKGSGTHNISGTYRYGFSNLNVDIYVSWNESEETCKIKLQLKEEDENTVEKSFNIEDLFLPGKQRQVSDALSR